MIKAILLGAVAAAAFAGGNSSASAEEYPFCIKDEGGPGDCKFVSYEQCLASISGRGGYCQRDPYFDQRRR